MKNSQILIIIFAIYYLIKYINYLFGDESKNLKNKKEPFTKPIRYFVNDTEIDMPHHIYYSNLLGAADGDKIDDNKIYDMTQRKLHAGRILQEEELNDLRAARFFLLDQWEHMVRMN